MAVKKKKAKARPKKRAGKKIRSKVKPRQRARARAGVKKKARVKVKARIKTKAKARARIKKKVMARGRVKARVKPSKPRPAAKIEGSVVGVVTHFFPRVNAAAIKLKAPLRMGDTVKFKGHTTDFIQTVNSLQVEHQPIHEAKRGTEIGMHVGSRVRHNDVVYKI